MQKQHLKNPIPFHDKNVQQTKNRQELLQPDEYLQKNPNLTSYLMAED